MQVLHQDARRRSGATLDRLEGDPGDDDGRKRHPLPLLHAGPCSLLHVNKVVPGRRAVVVASAGETPPAVGSSQDDQLHQREQHPRAARQVAGPQR